MRSWALCRIDGGYPRARKNCFISSILFVSICGSDTIRFRRRSWLNGSWLNGILLMQMFRMVRFWVKVKMGVSVFVEDVCTYDIVMKFNSDVKEFNFCFINFVCEFQIRVCRSQCVNEFVKVASAHNGTSNTII